MDIKIINTIPKNDIEFICNQALNDFADLEVIGSGCQAYVYKYKNYAIKDYSDGHILEKLQDNDMFLKLYFYTDSFMVTEFLEVVNSYNYHERNVEINYSAFDIFKYCHNKGLIPYDIHDSNVVVTEDDKLKIIDVGSFNIYSRAKAYAFSSLDNVLNHKSFKNEYEELNNIINYVKRPSIII